MTRFASALALVLATASVSQAIHIPDSLKDTVKMETGRVPTLRQKDKERKNAMQGKLAAMAVKPQDIPGFDRRQLDQANNNQDAGDYNWDEYMDEYSLGFDITSYSVKYTQCATVQSYSDNLAQDEYSDTVLAAQRFALFRLCPADQCSDYSNAGCASNYGEYLVSLDQFLMAMLEYQESRVAGYCEYCQSCAAIESAKNFWTTDYNTRDYALQVAEASYTVSTNNFCIEKFIDFDKYVFSPQQLLSLLL